FQSGIGPNRTVTQATRWRPLVSGTRKPEPALPTEILQRSWDHLPCHEGAVRHGTPAADRLRRAPPRRKALAVNIACRGRKKHAWRNCLGRAPWRRWSGFVL